MVYIIKHINSIQAASKPEYFEKKIKNNKNEDNEPKNNVKKSKFSTQKKVCPELKP